MSQESPDPRLWDARHFVYSFWVENERPPTVHEAAAGLQVDVERAHALYKELNARHALMLMPGTHVIRMANPFSGVPTGFRVQVGNKKYYANCAWDTFGIAAALHADAAIEAFSSQTQEPLRLSIHNETIGGDPAVIYFRVPFAHWYDDLVFT